MALPPRELGEFVGRAAIPLIMGFLGYKLYKWVNSDKNIKSDKFKENAIRCEKELYG